MDSNQINLITALATCGLVVCGVVIAYIQTRQNRLITTANSILNLNEKYTSSRMKRMRMEVCQSIKEKKDNLSSDELLRFFESIGNMTRRKVYDKQMIWNDFSRDIIFYYHLFRHFGHKDYIQGMIDETKDKTLFDEFEWLHNTMLSFEKKKRNGDYQLIKPNKNDLNQFLNKENNLIPNSELARL